MRELVVVHKAREPVLATVPEVPDERPLLESLAVLIEEAVAEPIVERSPQLAPDSVSSLCSSEADQSEPNAVFRIAQPVGGGGSPRRAGMGTIPDVAQPPSAGSGQPGAAVPHGTESSSSGS